MLSFRLLPHVAAWPALVGELCRLAARAVVVDYPTRRSVNAFAGAFFAAKKGVERDTRPFAVFSDREIADAFAAHGFRVTARRPQFLLPMALHRAHGCGGLGARARRRVPRALGLTRRSARPSSCARSAMAEPHGDWALALFRKSVLKQRKLAELARVARPDGRPALPRPRVRQRRRQPAAAPARAALGVGRPDGRGGRRRSARSSRRTCTGRRRRRLPFADAAFDRVAVVDMLEHAPDEARVRARALRASRSRAAGSSSTRRTSSAPLLRRLRHAIGQTDEKHGHLRPGYTRRAPARRCSRRRVRAGRRTAPTRASSRSSSTPPSTSASSGSASASSAKGMVVTGADVAKHDKAFRLYGAIYPFVWAVSQLDALVPASAATC